MTRGEKIGALVVLGFIAWRARPAQRAAAPKPQPAPTRAPVVKPVPLARIYKGPDDAYDVVRMSIETPNMPAREMGIFANRAAAEDVAKQNGWTVAP